MKKYYKATKETIKNITENIKNSKAAQSVKSAAESVKTERADEYIENNSTVYQKFDSFGMYVANKADKLLKKIGKKFRDSNAAKSTIAKIVSKITRILCILAAIAFAILVGYVLVRILPTIIMMTAFGFAMIFGIKFICWVMANAFGVEVA